MQDSVKISLVGPCSPADLADTFHPDQRARAIALPGYRGVPVSELAKGLIEQGHTVSIATLAYKSINESQHFYGPNIELVVHPGRPRARQFLSDNYRQERGVLSESIRAFNPDLVHGHWTYEFALAALDSGFPCGITAHDSPYTVVRYFKDAYRTARLLIALQVGIRAQNLSVVSPYLRDRWRNQMLFRGDIEVIPNSIPSDVSPPKRDPAAHPLIISVGDASRRKNISTLVNAFALVGESLPAAELRLIGPGLGKADEHKRLTEELAGAGQITYVGPVSRAELAKEYGRAWLLVHPSLEETFGLTLVEALNAGVPVVAGIKSGGVPYVLNYGQAGRLCTVEDPNTLAAAILESIWAGPPSVPSMSLDYLKSTFAPDVVARRYEDWYRRILGAS